MDRRTDGRTDGHGEADSRFNEILRTRLIELTDDSENRLSTSNIEIIWAYSPHRLTRSDQHEIQGNMNNTIPT